VLKRKEKGPSPCGLYWEGSRAGLAWKLALEVGSPVSGRETFESGFSPFTHIFKVGLPDLENTLKNQPGTPSKFEFQINSNFFFGDNGI
jgi:hypothetical protein